MQLGIPHTGLFKVVTDCSEALALDLHQSSAWSGHLVMSTENAIPTWMSKLTEVHASSGQAIFVLTER